MTSIRRAIATFSLVAILSTFVVSTAVAFNDVPATADYNSAVEALVANGAITAGDTFGPTAPLTRGEAVKYLVVSAGGYNMEEPATATFADVAKGSTYYKYVETAYKNGIVEGKSATATAKYFVPEGTVTRAEFAKMAAEAFDLPLSPLPTTNSFPDVLTTAWEFKYVEAAAEYKVVNGYTTGLFGPADPITKSQGAMMSFRAMNIDVTEEEEEDDTAADFDENGTTEGSISSMSLGSRDSTEALEGEVDVEVYVVDVETEDEGPLQLQRADFHFLQVDGDASTKPWDYFEQIALTVNGKVVKTLDTDSTADWSTKITSDQKISEAVGASPEYRLRFTGLKSVLANDAETSLGLLVTIKDSLDSDEESAEWFVELTEVRVMDESGVVTTDPTTVFATATALEESFDMAESDVAAFGYAVADDEIDAQLIEVNKSVSTNGVEIFAFDLEEEEGVDVNIEELQVTFETNDSNVKDVFKTAYLYHDGDKVATEAMTTTGVVLFDGLDIDIDGDTTETFTIVVDLNDMGGSSYNKYEEGTTIKVTIDEIMKATDANNNDEDDMTTTEIGLKSETHALRSEGVRFEYVSETSTVNSGDGTSDLGDFSITFKATAFGSDAYLEDDCEDSDAAVSGYTVSGLEGDAVCGLVKSGGDSSTGGLFKINKGASRNFVFSAAVEPATANVRAKLVIEEFTYFLATDGDAITYSFDMDDFESGAELLRYVDASS